MKCSRNDDYKEQNFKSNLLDFIVDLQQIDRISNHLINLYLLLRLEDFALAILSYSKWKSYYPKNSEDW